MQKVPLMIISLHQGIARMEEWRMAQPVDFTLDAGEHIAIVGANASGKTMLVDILTSAHPLIGKRVDYDFRSDDDSSAAQHSNLVSDNVRYISFRDTYGGDNDRKFYLQQRWNETEADDETPILGHVLEGVFLRTGEDSGSRRLLQEHLYEIFELRPLLDKPVVCLSSGELRKFVLCRALMAAPRVLILDNPFIGLDKAARQHLREAMEAMSAERHLQIILVLAKDADIPRFITHIVPVRDKVVLPKLSRESYLASISSSAVEAVPTPFTRRICEEIWMLPCAAPLSEEKRKSPDQQEVVRLCKVSVRYGARTILKELDWTVHKGERWALSGQNGAGKSTLLSLICADNPQSYACDISLFGRKRGSGESIWDIKRRIGYVSPELHRAYHHDMPALRIVASGLKDSVGLHVRPTEEENAVCRMWLRFMGIEHLADRSFMKMSSGEQRLVLLARAFVKDPELLILDEPFHGLDAERTIHVNAIIEAFCKRPNKTLIIVSHYEDELPPCITHRLHLVRND